MERANQTSREGKTALVVNVRWHYSAVRQCCSLRVPSQATALGAVLCAHVEEQRLS
jgi:hypothetical protein